MLSNRYSTPQPTQISMKKNNYIPPNIPQSYHDILHMSIDENNEQEFIYDEDENNYMKQQQDDDDDTSIYSYQSRVSTISDITSNTLHLNHPRNIITKRRSEDSSSSLSSSSHSSKKWIEPQMDDTAAFIPPTSLPITKRNQRNKINIIEEEEEEEVGEDEYEELTDENPDFLKFKQEVKDWIQLDDDIRTLQRAINERKKRKNDITPQILQFMGKYEIHNLNTATGKVAYTKTTRTKPMNKDYLKNKLSEFLKSVSKAERATEFLLNNREKEEKVILRRIVEKDKDI